MHAGRRSPARQRADAWLRGVLLTGIAVMINVLAREHLAWRRDLSEDQLHSLAPAAARMLGSLEDTLQVTAYFTGEAAHGPVQIAKGRLVEQLRELQELAGGRMRLAFADPNASSGARLEAARLGIAAVPMQAVRGTSVEVQQVWLGLVLRYRGRERAIPFVLPQRLEYAFLFELRRLLHDTPTAVGFFEEGPAVEPAPSYRTAREILSLAYDVREVRGLAEGVHVPADVAVLVVPRPEHVHPRAAWELERFLRGGGRLLLLADRSEVDVRTGAVRAVDTGLDELLAGWGLAVEPGYVWDRQCSNLTRPREVVVEGRPRRVTDRLEYPLWPAVRREGLSAEIPATARLEGAELYWAHPVVATGADPVAGLERTTLLASSESSWVVPALESFVVDHELLEATGAELLAGDEGAPVPLAVAVGGTFPAVLGAGGERPERRDPIREALWRDALRTALEEGRVPPERESAREPVPPGESVAPAPGQVVVFGDADWLRDGSFLSERNRLLFENLVDWLGLEEDLMSVRSRLPRERTITDFLERERVARGLADLAGAPDLERARELTLEEGRAKAAAARARRLRMAAATGSSLGLALLLVLGARLATRVRRGEGAA